MADFRCPSCACPMSRVLGRTEHNSTVRDRETDTRHKITKVRECRECSHCAKRFYVVFEK